MNPSIVKRIVAEGTWTDASGALHFDLPRILDILGLPPTRENEALVNQAIRRAVAERWPNKPVQEVQDRFPGHARN